jgi:hypothetical protein
MRAGIRFEGRRGHSGTPEIVIISLFIESDIIQAKLEGLWALKAKSDILRAECGAISRRCHRALSQQQIIGISCCL